MTIDPRVGVYFSIVMAIVSALGVCGTQFTTLFGATNSEKILAVIVVLNVINGAINAVLHMIPSKPGAPREFALGPKVTPLLLLAILILGALAWPGNAMAQVKLKPLTGNLGNDLGITTSSKASTALDNIATVLAKPFTDIANFIGADADQAIALSTVLPALQDGHGQQCWIAMKSFGDIIKAHPIPITFHVINDYETLRLLGMATNNLCSNVHCTQVFADATAMAQAASPIPLAIPSLHDLCTKVPQIAVVAPVTLVPPAGAPVATPTAQ